MIVFALGTFAVAAAGVGDWGIWWQLAVAAGGSVLITAANPPRGLTSRRRSKPAPPSFGAPVPPAPARPVGLLSRLTKVAAQILVISLALGVLGVALTAFYGFASGVVKRPSGVDDAAILAVVDAQLRQCAGAAVLRPINCPQRHNEGSAEAVKWSLYGRPVDGAKVEWDGLAKTFNVYGTAVMTVRYVSESGQELDVVPFGYRFSVEWVDGRAVIKSVAGTGGDLDMSTVRRRIGDKPRPAQPESEFQAVLRRAFEWCASSRVASPPPECPVQAYRSESESDFRWSLPADPLLNSTVGFDDEFGLIKVSGDYVLRLDYINRYTGPEHTEYQGRYEATLVVHDGQPTVLEIEEL